MASAIMSLSPPPIATSDIYSAMYTTYHMSHFFTVYAAGEFFLAELIESQDEHHKTIVADVSCVGGAG